MKAAGTDTMKNEIKYEKSELELMTTYQLSGGIYQWL